MANINQELKEEFIALLKSTKRQGIADLLDYLEGSDFYESPASTQYHGSYPGGLLEHSINVYNSLVFVYESIKQNPGFIFPEIEDDSLIIVGLLHDICKVNTYHESTRNVKNDTTGQWEKVPFYKRDPMLPMGHGGKSVFMLQKFIDLSTEEALAVYWHMGGYDISQYSNVNELGKAYENNLLAFLLHQADMMATYVVENERYIDDANDVPF